MPMLPALPTDSNTNTGAGGGASGGGGMPPMRPGAPGMGAPGAGPGMGPGGPQSSPLAGGISTIVSAVQQIDQGWQGLAQALPSIAPIAAQRIAEVRTLIVNAAGTAAGAGAPGGAGMMQPPSTGPSPSAPQPPVPPG